MSAAPDRPNTLPWPPIAFAAAVALAIVLNWLAPLPWLSGPLAEFLFAVGWLVAAGGLAIAVAAVRTLRRARTAVSPIHAADHLVTAGPYSFSRNPIYLGGVTLLIGVALITGIVWFAIFALLAGFVIGKLAIKGEERHLETRFGKKWRDYAKKVRCWI